jgi:hypothetical protein
MRLTTELLTPYLAGTTRDGESAIIGGVVVLAGEWVPAWLFMSMTFLVATLGVAGLGWWVLRGDSRNRAAEEMEPESTEGHP